MGCSTSAPARVATQNETQPERDTSAALQRVHMISNGHLAGGEWIFDGETRIILNLAVGGNFLAPPTDETPFPSTMSVDWVRYWQRDHIEP